MSWCGRMCGVRCDARAEILGTDNEIRGAASRMPALADLSLPERIAMPLKWDFAVSPRISGVVPMKECRL